MPLAPARALQTLMAEPINATLLESELSLPDFWPAGLTFRMRTKLALEVVSQPVHVAVQIAPVLSYITEIAPLVLLVALDIPRVTLDILEIPLRRTEVAGTNIALQLVDVLPATKPVDDLLSPIQAELPAIGIELAHVAIDALEILVDGCRLGGR